MNWKKKLSTCTIISVLSVLIIHIVNRIIYFVSTLNDFLSGPEGHYYDWRFGKIFYTKKGSGKPILLIHDLNTAFSGYEWHELTERLSKTNTVYVIDLLGCGRSHKPDITYTNYLYVQMITDFIRHIIGRKTDVIASGLSSSFVLMACHNDDSIIDKVVMVSPHSLFALNRMPSGNTKIIKMLINIPVIGTLVYNILFSKKKLAASLERDYFYDGSKLTDDFVNICYESAHTRKTAAKYLFSSIKGRYVNCSVAPVLNKLDNSIFIITGDEEMEDINASAIQYQRLAPSIEIINIANTLLVPHLEQPEEFLKQIQILLEIEHR